MQPQQPYSNPYEFIVNPQQPKRTPIVNLSGGNPIVKVVFVVGILVVVVIVLGVGSVILKGAGSGNVKNMEAVAEDQQELIRVANEAVQEQSNDIQQSTTLYYAQNTELSISSAQQRLLAFLSANGVKPSTQILALKNNAHTDTALSNAAASSTYDPTFLNAMQGNMTTYVSDIKIAFTASTNPHEKQLLQQEYSEAALLNQQLSSALKNVNAGT